MRFKSPVIGMFVQKHIDVNSIENINGPRAEDHRGKESGQASNRLHFTCSQNIPTICWFRILNAARTVLKEDKYPSLVHIMVQCRTSTKPLSKQRFDLVNGHTYGDWDRCFGLGQLTYNTRLLNGWMLHCNFTYKSPVFNNRLLYVLLMRRCRTFKIFTTGCTGSCQHDNFHYRQWWQFRQNGDISVSVMCRSYYSCAVRCINGLIRCGLGRP